jgi:VIT1/CCC1 family predicted Fe2+/Mn2+ transporter
LQPGVTPNTMRANKRVRPTRSEQSPMSRPTKSGRCLPDTASHRKKARQRSRHSAVGLRRPFTSALTIAGAYIGGGFIPLAPYVFTSSVGTALPSSIAVTLAALMVFGYIKGRFTGAQPGRSAAQTVLVGGLAAAAAFALARLIS